MQQVLLREIGLQCAFVLRAVGELAAAHNAALAYVALIQNLKGEEDVNAAYENTVAGLGRPTIDDYWYPLQT